LARTARALAATRVAIVPTLVVHEMLSRLTTDAPVAPGHGGRPGERRQRARCRRAVARTGWRTSELQAFRRSRARQNQFVREFKRAGGLIAAGSDAANQLLVPGLSLHEELSLLVAAGLTPVEALTAATRKGAELLRADSLGRIAAGKVADLIVLDANPAANIAATRRIAWSCFGDGSCIPITEENMAKVRLALPPSCCWALRKTGSWRRERPYDLVLKNGWIVDGSGNPATRATSPSGATGSRPSDS